MLAIHELHIRLEKAFRENNIEIPFPQRDIHIRSVAQQFDAALLYPEKVRTNVHTENVIV
jgi:small-conductance mechanosensitive channel